MCIYIYINSWLDREERWWVGGYRATGIFGGTHIYMYISYYVHETCVYVYINEAHELLFYHF